MPIPTNEETGARIAKLRKDKQLTQHELAAKANLHVATVQRAESGKPSKLETFKDIAEVLGVGLGELLEAGR